jgi:hypothetical protein
VAPAKGCSFFSLVRGKDGIQRPAGAPDDRIHVGLHTAPHGSQLTSLPVHDRIDPLLLLCGQTELTREPVSELAVARRVAAGPMSEAGSSTPVRKQHHPIEENSGHSSGEHCQ